jgi:hypothetical protein
METTTILPLGCFPAWRLMVVARCFRESGADGRVAQGWWMCLAPLTGMWIARISKARPLRHPHTHARAHNQER